VNDLVSILNLQPRNQEEAPGKKMEIRDDIGQILGPDILLDAHSVQDDIVDDLFSVFSLSPGSNDIDLKSSLGRGLGFPKDARIGIVLGQGDDAKVSYLPAAHLTLWAFWGRRSIQNGYLRELKSSA